MAFHDLIDDGSFKWLYRSKRASIAQQGDRARVDIGDGDYVKAAPMMFPTNAKLLAAVDKLERDIVRDGKGGLLGWTALMRDAISSIVFPGEVA